MKAFEDVQLLVRSFYNKVLDEYIPGPFFAYVRTAPLGRSSKTLDSFWNNVLYFEGGYNRNPLAIHTKLHFFKQLKHSDFERWLLLFTTTIDELFEGEKAELAKQRAMSIATIMRIKIVDDNRIDFKGN